MTLVLLLSAKGANQRFLGTFLIQTDKVHLLPLMVFAEVAVPINDFVLFCHLALHSGLRSHLKIYNILNKKRISK